MKQNLPEVDTKISKKIEGLIATLTSEEAARRMEARSELIDIGRPAIPPLLKLLSHAMETARWEACKILGIIGEKTACQRLVQVLKDESFDVRWVAAESLVAMGPRSVIPVLQALEMNFDSVYLREGALHILRVFDAQGMLNRKTRLVIDALNTFEPGISIALAARTALDSLNTRVT